MDTDERLDRMEAHMLAHRVLLGVLLNRVARSGHFPTIFEDMEADVRAIYDSEALWAGTSDEDRDINHRVLHEVERVLRPRPGPSPCRTER